MLSSETLAGVSSPAATEFLLHAYAERYPAGRARGKRLVLLAEKASLPLRRDVVRAAAAEVRTTTDSPLYRRLCEVEAEADSAVWLERVERENRVRRSQLDANLSKSRTEAAREPIRLALRDLGMFFRESGDATGALKAFFQGKDLSTTPTQHLEMALMVMECGLDFSRYDYASPFALKAEQLLPPSPPNTKPSGDHMKIRVALGLCDLDRRRYKMAARHFISANPDIKFSAIVAPEDLAFYAVFCALATFSRPEIKESLIDNNSFKAMLELVPVVKGLLMDFYNSRYASVMRTLDAALPVLLLEPFLCIHAESLVRDIKTQALLQCVAPYSCVKLEKMAKAFGLDTKAIEAEIAQLITKGQIQARIDSQNGMLIARRDDKRDVALAAAIGSAQTFVREGRATLLRMNLLENLVVYNPPRRKEKAAVPSMLQSGGGDYYLESDEEEDGGWEASAV